MPILAAIFAAIAAIGELLATYRKVAAFVIAGAIWAGFLWVLGIVGERLDLTGSQLTTAHSGAAVSAISGLVSTFDKVQYMFPIYTVFQCLGLYMSLRLSALLLNWLFRIWDAVPFKSSAGA